MAAHVLLSLVYLIRTYNIFLFLLPLVALLDLSALYLSK